MRVLRQATASQSRTIGPFIDDTDFKTAKTGLTIANTDIKLIINGAASANKNSGGGTHRANGEYGVTFDATDTATVGEIKVSVVVSSALPVTQVFTVVEEAVYDALYAASAAGPLQSTVAGRTLDVSATGEAGVDWANIGSPSTSVTLSGTNINEIANVGAGGFNLASVSTNGRSLLGLLTTGTAQSATSSTIVLASATNFTTDSIPVGATIFIYGGTGVGESRTITAYTNSSDTATVSPAWTTTPDNTSTYMVYAGPPAVSTSLPDVNVASFTAGALTSGAFASGAITAASIAADAIGASELASDAVAEIAAGILDAAAGVETSVTLRQAMRLMLAVAAGKVSGAGTSTIVFRNAVDDSKNRVTGTDDSSGNRTAITYDLT